MDVKQTLRSHLPPFGVRLDAAERADLASASELAGVTPHRLAYQILMRGVRRRLTLARQHEREVPGACAP